MRVEEIMSTPVVFTQKIIKVSSLKDMLARKRINAVLVIGEDESISGIITSSNIISCHDGSRLVQDLMSDFVHVVMPNNRVKDAAKSMVKHSVHHLVAMQDGKVVGMLSSMDILKVYADLN